MNPDNPCQRCRPLALVRCLDRHGRQPTCSDGLFCTENEKCVAGACVGTPRECGSLFSCATGTCNETTDQCDTLIAGCLIDNACFVALQTNPQNPCQMCDPALSSSVWSNVPLGALCSDGQFCTVDDAVQRIRPVRHGYARLR